MICSKNKFEEEILRIKEILSDNKFPEDIISKHISDKISQFFKPKVFGPDKCIVYLRSLFLGSASLPLKKNIKTAVKNCYSTVVTRTVHATKPI